MFESIVEELFKIGHFTFSTVPNTPIVFECNWEDLAHYFNMAKYDVEKNYIQLPLDVNGVPIAIGDKMERLINGFNTVVEVIAVGEDIFQAKGYRVPFPAKEWHHKQESQTGKILRSFVKDIYESNSKTDDLIDKYKEIIEKNVRKN